MTLGEDILEGEERGCSDVREGEDRLGVGAGEEVEEGPDLGTEEHQYVTGEADLLASPCCDGHLAGAVAHQPEGGL